MDGWNNQQGWQNAQPQQNDWNNGSANTGNGVSGLGNVNQNMSTGYTDTGTGQGTYDSYTNNGTGQGSFGGVMSVGIGIDASKNSVFGFSLMMYGVLACILTACGYTTALLTLLMVVALLEKDTDKNLVTIIVSMAFVVLGLELIMMVVSLVREPVYGVVSILFGGAEYGSALYAVRNFLQGLLNGIVSIIRWVRNIFLLYYGISSMKNIRNGVFKPSKFIAKWVNIVD